MLTNLTSESLLNKSWILRCNLYLIAQILRQKHTYILSDIRELSKAMTKFF